MVVDAVKMCCEIEKCISSQDIPVCILCGIEFEDDVTPEKEIYIDLYLQNYIYS